MFGLQLTDADGITDCPAFRAIPPISNPTPNKGLTSRDSFPTLGPYEPILNVQNRPNNTHHRRRRIPRIRRSRHIRLPDQHTDGRYRMRRHRYGLHRNRNHRMNNITPQQWATRLRDPDSLQTRMELHTPRTGGYCCLGHLADMQDPDGWQHKTEQSIHGEPIPVALWHGADAMQPETKLPEWLTVNAAYLAQTLNDDHELTLSEIACWVDDGMPEDPTDDQIDAYRYMAQSATNE